MTTINDTARRVLAATPTGHESTMSAADIAATLEAAGVVLTSRQVAAALGRLRQAGLVERDTQDSTWARYDSWAEGLDREQTAALAAAEYERPSARQVQAVETYGPRGLGRRVDLGDLTQARIDSNAPGALTEAARQAAEAGLFHRAADLVGMAVTYTAGAGRRARLEQRARDYRRQAEALEAEAQEAERQAAQEAAEAVPATLNGHDVLASWPRPGATPARLVLVHRPGHTLHKFVVATWWADLGDSWEWGHYLEGPQEVRAHLEAEGLEAEGLEAEGLAWAARQAERRAATLAAQEDAESRALARQEERATAAADMVAQDAQEAAEGVHRFTSSGGAYDMTQCDDDIATGHALVVADESAVALAWAWPVAVTTEAGAFHTVAAPEGESELEAARRVLADAGISAAQVARAVAEADALAAEVTPWARAIAAEVAEAEAAEEAADRWAEAEALGAVEAEEADAATSEARAAQERLEEAQAATLAAQEAALAEAVDLVDSLADDGQDDSPEYTAAVRALEEAREAVRESRQVRRARERAARKAATRPGPFVPSRGASLSAAWADLEEEAEGLADLEARHLEAAHLEALETGQERRRRHRKAHKAERQERRKARRDKAARRAFCGGLA